MDFLDQTNKPVAEYESDWERLNRIADENPDDFNNWEQLVQATEQTDGGINRNSPSSAITAMRNIYDRFLGRFPLLFGYWKKFADFEYSVSGSESADKVYARGIAGIPYSVDLWTHYVSFKMETCHELDTVRSLFEQGADRIGLDFLSHTFWDKYIEYEERMEAFENVYKILERIIHIPMHQYARYFEKFTQYAQTRPLTELAAPEVIEQARTDVLKEPAQSVMAGEQQITMERGELDIEREIRSRLHNYHLEIFHQTQLGTTKRWTYESEIKRPYFLVTELDAGQLSNWKKYLDFEEVEGDFNRVVYLYEKALVPCALYDEMWLRYARWMDAHPGMEEQTRNIYYRAAALFVPIARPGLRVQWAYWEESQREIESARDILRAVLDRLPSSLEVLIALVHLERRAGGGQLEGPRQVIRSVLDDPQVDYFTKAKVATEDIRLTWKCEGKIEEARTQFEKAASSYLDSKYFWINYLRFEIDQGYDIKGPSRVTRVMNLIRNEARLPQLSVRDLTHLYQEYLLEQGHGHEAIDTYFTLDQQVDGPFSVQSVYRARLSANNDPSDTDKYALLTNGHVGIEVKPEDTLNGVNPYTALYKEQGEYGTAAPEQAA